MTDTSPMFKNSGSLSPSATRQIINLTSADQSITTVQMGGTLILQTGDRLYPDATIPTFASVTVGSKKGEVELQLPPASTNVAIFNSGTDGTDATLEDVLSGETGADVLYKATAQNATGSIKKMGHGRLRTLWPLDPDVVREVDMGSVAGGTSMIVDWGVTPHQSCALKSTLAAHVFLDSNNDIKLIAASCNADGTDRGNSAVTTIRANANTLQFPQIQRISDTLAAIVWWDATASVNEFVAVSITDAATPIITLGAVTDDSAIAAGNRINGARLSATADFNSDSNSAYWCNGNQATATNGHRAYRLSINTGTLATTINHNFQVGGALTNGAVYHKGCSPAADRFLVCQMEAASDGRVAMLQYSAGSISRLWVTPNGLNVDLSVAGAATRIEQISSTLYFLQGYDNGIGFSGGFLYRIPNIASENNHTLTPIKGLRVFGTTGGTAQGNMLIEGEAILTISPVSKGWYSVDLINFDRTGPNAITDQTAAYTTPHRPLVLPHPLGTHGNVASYCVHPATRRVTFFSYSNNVSGNTKIAITRFAWPRR